MKDHQWVVSYVRGLLEAHGHFVEEASMRGCAHDLIVDHKVRIEVKTCKRAESGLFKFVIKPGPQLFVFAGRVKGAWEYGIVLGKDCQKAQALYFKATDGRVLHPAHALAALPRLVRALRGRVPKLLRCGLRRHLDAADKRVLCKLYATGSYTLRYLGWRFGVSRTRVWQLVRKDAA